MEGFADDYLPKATDAYGRAIDPNKGAVKMGAGDRAEAAHIAALIAIAQRLDAILNVLQTQGGAKLM